MWTEKVELLTTVTAAGWIRPRLAGGLGQVADTIPTGFEAYARILHPIEGAREESLRWADVAAVTGRTIHPEVQWHTLIGAPDPWSPASDLWDEGEPAQGSLALPQLLALCEVLARHTSTPDDCYFALWEGWGQLHAGARARLTLEGKRRYRLPRFLRRPVRGTPIPPVITATELQAPRVHLPARDHLLFRGPLSAMDAFAHYDGAATPFPQTQSPALFWPADRAWCVATEIDFTSTLVAATAAAVDDVVAHPLLEVLPLTGAESLRHEADTINQ